MRQEVERGHWAAFLEDFTWRNRHRAARLEIRGWVGAAQAEGDYPLADVTLHEDGEGAPHVEISLADPAPGGLRVLRGLPRVRLITLWTRPDGSDGALEVENDGGERALVCLEPASGLPAA